MTDEDILDSWAEELSWFDTVEIDDLVSRSDALFYTFSYVPYYNVKAVLVVESPSVLVDGFDNILIELGLDVGVPPDDLVGWQHQGVLILFNSPIDEPDPEWAALTEETIRFISENTDSVAFMIWGDDISDYSLAINRRRHLILTSRSPNKESAHKGFFGNRHFSKCNMFLQSQGITPIDWSA